MTSLATPGPTSGAPGPYKATAFDEAVSLRVLLEAADDYASRHGQIGSADYRAAWLRFRQHVKTIEDLQRVRARASRTTSKS